MSNRARQWITCVAWVLGCHMAGALAQVEPRADERLHAEAVSYFRQARFPEAYGRFVALANAGHAPSAEVALWMHRNGPSLFGSQWDSSPEQLAAWAQLARRPTQASKARRG